MRNAQSHNQAEPGAVQQRNFTSTKRSKSTSTEAQYERILCMLRTGPKNTMELRKAGVMMPSARIKEMNDRHGYYIPTIELVPITDEWGFSHARVAVYELIDEPSARGLA